MGYLVLGVIILVATLGGLRFCLPTTGGQMKPFLENGFDTWAAIAVTVSAVLGIGAIVVGVVELIS